MGLAARVWQHASLATATTQGLRKLRAGGVAVDESALTIIEPALATDEPAFDAVFDAVTQRRPISFEHQSVRRARDRAPGTSSRGGSCRGTATGTSSATTATATPSGCSGSRASSATSSPIGEPGSYQPPVDLDLRALAESLAPPHPHHSATVRVRVGAGRSAAPAGRRARARSTTSGPSSSCPMPAVSRWPTSCCRTAPTSSSSGPDEVRADVDTPARRCSREERAHDARTRRARSSGCSRWCRTCATATASPSTTSPATSGCKPAQIVKDLKVLWFCGLPNSVSGDMIDIDMEALDGEGVVKLSNADYLTRPLRLAPHEALALMVALRALREVSAPGERDVVDRALKKIEAAAGDVGERAAAVDIHIDPVDTQIRVAVEQALREGRRLAITYYTPSRDETSDREVDPMRLIFFEGHSYLEAWCLRAEEVRMFRLDRMRGCRGARASRRPRPPMRRRSTCPTGCSSPTRPTRSAVLELQPQARWVADYYPVEDRRASCPTVGCGSSCRFSNNGWLERLVLRLGGHAKLLEPDELGRRCARSRRGCAGATTPAERLSRIRAVDRRRIAGSEALDEAPRCGRTCDR